MDDLPAGPEQDKPLTFREKVFGYGVVFGVLAVVAALTLLTTGLVILFAGDTYAGITTAADRGIHGSYLVTELVTSAKAPSTLGTFASADGSIVLEGTKLTWDSSDVGTVLPCQYVPGLRDGRLPVVVMSGWPGDIIAPVVALVICLAVAGVGWWFLGAALIGSRSSPDGRRTESRRG